MIEINNSQPKIDWVEFIGASGVGKSTLYDETIKTRTADDRWITDGEALDEIAKKYLIKNRSVLPFRIRVKQFIKIISPLHRYRSYDAVSSTLRNLAWEALSEEYDFLCELMIQFAHHQYELEAHKRLAFLSWFYVNRLRDFIVMEYFPVLKIIVHGDGILHNLGGIVNYDMGFPNVEVNKYEKLNCMPTGLVHCTADESVVLARLKQREQSGLGTIFQNGMDDTSLAEFVRSGIKSSANKVDFFRRKGVPILAIDTSDDLKENSKIINNFISGLKPRFFEV